MKTVCIIERRNFRPRAARYQVMYPVACSYNHVWPGHLFTLEDAQAFCREHDLEILATGDEWELATGDEWEWATGDEWECFGAMDRRRK